MSSQNINLLPSAQWNHSWTAYFLKWIVTYGKYALIITELIVISAFLMRFKLDQDLLEVKDQINNDVAILQSSKAFETQIADLSRKQNLIIKEWQKTPTFSRYIKAVTESMPQNIILNSLSLNQGSMTLVGYSPNESSLAYFLKYLKQNSAFKGVSLTKISSELSPSNDIKLIAFTIQLSLKPIYVKYQ